MTHNLSKWPRSWTTSPVPSKWHKTAVTQMLQNQQKYLKQLHEHHKNYGPNYCDKNGLFITADDAANPKYIPHIRFWSEDGVGGRRVWVYNLLIEGFYEFFGGVDDRRTGELSPISREDIPDWIIEEIFSRIPKLYDGSIGSFTKFVLPMMRKTFPKLIAQNLVSVQPMTQPIGGLPFYKVRYGVSKGKTKKTK